VVLYQPRCALLVDHLNKYLAVVAGEGRFDDNFQAVVTRRGDVMTEAEGLPRRVLLAGVAAATVVVVGGCATYDQSGGAPVDAGDTDPEDPETEASGDPPASESPAPKPALASTNDVPVRGGKILDSRKIVVTQPEPGSFKAFSAVCTHQGCVVAQVKENTISCPCHGSQFNAANGEVQQGPARSALREINIKVDGTAIRLA
jgi:Rieske Fe-S protein